MFSGELLFVPSFFLAEGNVNRGGIYESEEAVNHRSTTITLSK